MRLTRATAIRQMDPAALMRGNKSVDGLSALLNAIGSMQTSRLEVDQTTGTCRKKGCLASQAKIYANIIRILSVCRPHGCSLTSALRRTSSNELLLFPVCAQM